MKGKDKPTRGEIELADRVSSGAEIEREQRIQASTRSLAWKERVFVASYVGTANRDAVLAAEMAGFANPIQSAQRLLEHSGVKAAIRSCGDFGIPRESLQLSRDGLLARYAEIVDFDKTRYMERLEDGSLTIDLDMLRQENMGHMIKSISNGRYGIKIEFEDRMAAMEVLAKYHGIFQNQELHLHAHSHQAANEITYVNDWRGNRAPEEGDQAPLSPSGTGAGPEELPEVQLGVLRETLEEDDSGDLLSD